MTSSRPLIENDIVSAAGIEKKAAFTRSLQLIAGRVGQLFNASDIGTNVRVTFATVQSWVQILEENGILRSLRPYYSNINKRLIKAPKIYFEDVALAVRMRGWTGYAPLFASPLFGSLVENIAIGEFSRRRVTMVPGTIVAIVAIDKRQEWLAARGNSARLPKDLVL